LPIPGPAGRQGGLCQSPGLRLAVIAAFPGFLLQGCECGPAGLISLAADLHRVVAPW